MGEKLSRVAFLIALVLLVGAFSVPAHAACASSPCTVTSSSGSSVSVDNSSESCSSSCTTTAGTPVPIAVSAAGNPLVSTVSITLNGYSAVFNTSPSVPITGSRDMGLLLISPSGRNLELMRCIGHGGASGQSNITLTISDSSSNVLPSCNGTDSNVGNWSPAANSSVNYKPAAYADTFSTGAPDYGAVISGFNNSDLNVPANQGTSTLTNVFTGDTVSGTWTLYLVATAREQTQVSFSSWSITFTYTAASVPSATSLSVSTPASTDPTHVQAGAAYTSGNDSTIVLTADVSGSSGTPTGTVTFQDISNGTTTNLSCNGGSDSVTLSGGSATCSTTISKEGYRSLEASYSGNSTYVASSGNSAVFMQNHAVNTGTQYCNPNTTGTGPGTPEIAGNGDSNHSSWAPAGSTENTNPYPSVIFVGDGINTNIANSVNTVSVVLNDFLVNSSTSTAAHLLLLAPGGQAYDFIDGVGTSVFNGGTYHIQDGGSSMPESSAGTLASGTYEPTAYTVSPFTPAPPAPAPTITGNISAAQPSGSATFLSTFAGATAHGPWSLFLYDDSGSLTTTNLGSWCIDISPATGVPTSVSVQATVNGATTQRAALSASVTFTATVSASSTVNTGTVTFTDTYTASGLVTTLGTPNVSNGTASITTSSLIEGDHLISAIFQDGSTFNDNTGTLQFRVDATTPAPAVSGNSYTYCNLNAITIPADQAPPNDKGPAAPNPSNIFVTNMPGTISSVTLTLEQFHMPSGGGNFLDSLLVGPNGSSAPTRAQTLDFFSDLTSNNSFGPNNYTFTDSGTPASVTCPAPFPAVPATTLAPASCTASTSYTASPFYTLPSTFQHAATAGSSTLNGVYGNTNGNGTWSLYFNQTADDTTGGVNNGWCMDFTENAVSVGINENHVGTNGAGSNFVQGEAGAQLTTVITNNGPGSTGDPLGTNPLTVTDTLNAAFTYQSFSGTGWSCSASGQTVTCTNDTPVAQGNTYPTLTLNINVSTAAPSTVTNSVNVHGAGITPNQASDTITITTAPVLTISKSHTGTFTQGQTAQWTITVSDEAANGTTSGTANLSDTLPSGYTLNTYSSAGNVWTCGSTITNPVTVSCISTEQVAGGNAYNTLQLIVNVPANSPISVSNTASAWGGGDLVHTSSGTAVMSNTDTVTVVQVPATISINGNQTQSATINTAFGSLAVTVKDGGGVAIPNYSPVVFTATTGANGQSGVFSFLGTATTSVATNGAGVANPGTFTANNKVGSYSVGVTAGSATTSFSLTNTVGAPASITPTSGSGQSANVNTLFANPLVATVLDAGSNPVPNVTVTFTAPAQTGASVTFAGGINTAVTNANGVATSTAITANGIAGGPYNVVASINSLTANFSLRNVGSAATITNVTSSVANGSYTVGAVIPILITFSHAVNVTGTPLVALNSGGTAAYASGSGTATLTFTYTVAAGQNSPALDVTSTSALTLNGGTITDSSNTPANLTLPAPGAAGSLSVNKSIVINTTAPTVVSYSVNFGSQRFNLATSTRNRLPWEITGVTVVFSQSIATATIASLAGVTATSVSGVGTNTLTWTINPLALGNFVTTLAGSGANAIKDAAGNPLSGGAGFSQNIKVLFGDFNDDGVVNAADLTGVNNAIAAPYNIFADINGDGVVNTVDVGIVRTRIGTSLP